MAAAARDHPETPAGKVWRYATAPMVSSAIGAVFIGAVTLFLLVFSFILSATDGLRIGLFMLALVLFTGFMTVYVARDALGKRPWRIDIEPDHLILDLPAIRSLIHNPPAYKGTVAVADIAAVETRLEAYKGWFSAMLQRAYRLRLKEGDDIFLFEDRAVGTVLSGAPLYPVCADIAQRTGLPFDDLGMAQGINGLLGVAFVHAPAWGAAALPPEQQARIWFRARLTGGLAVIGVLLVVVLAVVF
jgi:hypothetical protein